MDFGLTETQELIRSSAREFLADRSGPATVRAVAEGDAEAIASLWKDVVELGWPALTVPEEHGGAGLSFSDLAVLLEELGASLAPIPIVESAITSRILERYGPDAIKVELLPQIATGDVMVTPAIVERDASWEARSAAVVATRTGSSLVITGEKRFVSFADQATHALTLVRTDDDGPALVVVPIWKSPGVVQTPMKHASGVPVSSLNFNEVEVSPSNTVATGGEAVAATEELVAAGGVARAAQLAGLARAVVDSTVKYTSNRQQFGRPVGSFQAIQHHLAEMAVAAKQVNHLAHSAAWSFTREDYSVRRAAQAKIAASEKIPALCWTAHQCHGAIGFTWEHDLHLYTRRALAWKTDFGDPAFHKAILAGAMGL
ncbi:MAG: acyl-CoA/acyl-ACP dehydrogenase [Chloroflexi bacterium]|nr:acyl-CoA/acyl-ACP dehydrogenase [Chloroflexota bacterium]MCI0880519.1 acyl-CoA/acyl-ACP dehydrogenase [Chloroflexota bacterium]